MARTIVTTAAMCAALLAAGRAQAVSEAAMLNTCQKAVGTAASTFVKGKETAISACLNAVSGAIIGKQGTDPSAAAKICVAQFRLLNDSRALGKSLPEKLAAAIAKSCNPNASLTQGDVLGSPSSLAQTLEVSDQLGEWCAAFGGNGTIATVSDWTTCVNSAAECAVDTAVSTQYPRALEWLAAVKPKMNNLTAPSGDPTQITDAVAALDAVKAAIDGPNNDNIPSPACGQGGQLLTCQTDLTSCDTDLTSCSASLGTCPGNLTTCTGNLSTCQGSLTTCNAGTAAAGHVLSGKTFSSSAGLGVTGTMANNGAISFTPGTSAQPIPAGYYNGSGSVAGDANLVAGNIVSGINLFGVTGTALAPAALTGQRLRTGQTQCDLGAGTVGGCPGSPSGQDGAVVKGLTRSYTDNGDGTITDNLTGLMWEKLSRDWPSIHDYNNVYTWYTAFTTKIATLNGGGGFAGHTDWRLPNVNELQSIVNYGASWPAVDAAFNTSCDASCTVTTCSCTQSSGYWSSTTYQSGPGYAWAVWFYDGNMYDNYKSVGYFVRAVRGGS
jgi:hypothetical protein